MTCHAHQLAASRGFLLPEDVDLIRFAVASYPRDRPLYVVDLGAGSGTTALSVFAERPDAYVETIDRDPDNLAWAALAVNNAGYGIRDPGGRGIWIGLERDSSDPPEDKGQIGAGRSYRPDFLMVDASHEEADVRADLAAWLPLLWPGALVWLHDYTDQYPGVVAAVDAVVAAGQLVPVRTAGWGWLGRIPVPA